jgi:nitrogenase molybdenum-iron protein alpha/beta subunit
MREENDPDAVQEELPIKHAKKDVDLDVNVHGGIAVVEINCKSVRSSKAHQHQETNRSILQRMAIEVRPLKEAMRIQ